MKIKEELLSDITTSLDLLAKYSDLDKKEVTSLISSVVNGTKNKNLIDLFVIREFVKDKVQSILAADIDQDRAAMDESTQGPDFDSGDLPADGGMTGDAEGGEVDPNAQPEEDPEAKAFEDRKQELLDSAEGYLESIDLGISNIENGDVNLELVGQLIDLKTLIQDAIDKVNKVSGESEYDESSLNILEAILNNLEPGGEENSPLEEIIKNVSAGTVEADSGITELISKINDIVENPEEYLNPSSEGDEEAGDGDELEIGSDEIPDDLNGDETDEPEGPSAADEFVEDVKEKEGAEDSDSDSGDEDQDEEKPKKQVTSSTKKSKGIGVLSALLEEDDSDLGEPYEDDDEGIPLDDEPAPEPVDGGEDDDIFAFDTDDYAQARSIPTEDAHALYGAEGEGEDGDTTPYVDEIADVDFQASDVPSKYRDPDEVAEEEDQKERFKAGIEDLRDTFDEKLSALEDEFGMVGDEEAGDGDEPIDGEEHLDSEGDSLLSTEEDLGEDDESAVVPAAAAASKEEGDDAEASVLATDKKAKVLKKNKAKLTRRKGR